VHTSPDTIEAAYLCIGQSSGLTLIFQVQDSLLTWVRPHTLSVGVVLQRVVWLASMLADVALV
jgi:hypothetical protein